jgi:hypothetical protein
MRDNSITAKNRVMAYTVTSPNSGMKDTMWTIKDKEKVK